MSEATGPLRILNNKRVGRIVIAIDYMNTRPENVMAVMGRLMPVSVIYIQRERCFEYLCISPDFDELADDEIVPQYRSQVSGDGEVSFIRTSFKRNIPHSINQEIVRVIMENQIDLAKFKEFVKKRAPNTKDEDFEEYDESFLEALNMYVDHLKHTNGQ